MEIRNKAMSTKTAHQQKTTLRTSRTRAQARRLARFVRRKSTAATQRLWQILRRLWSWIYGRLVAMSHRCLELVASLNKHVLSPTLCFACIYVGVLLTMALPVSMWSWLAMPLVANFTEIGVTTFCGGESPVSVHPWFSSLQ
jgi:hypothetical protein